MTVDSILQQIQNEGNFRTIPAQSSSKLIDLSSNDYLGLGCDMRLQQAFIESQSPLPPFTSSASRLLAGRQMEYEQLELFLSELYDRPVLLMNSGYHANTGAISALASGASTLIVADKLVHASIIDGIVLSRAPFERFRHNDTEHLSRILSKQAHHFERVIIVTESVFSMDGDKAPLPAIADIKRSYPNALLYVDEAHAIGVEGKMGLGLSHTIPDVDIFIGTFGKACASMGAFIAVSTKPLRDLLINRARSFIFSTSLPPINCAWTKFVLGHIIAMDDTRNHLHNLAIRLHSVLSPHTSTPIEASHIQPLIIGDARKAIQISQSLLSYGFKVLPIRTPTVPPGTERLRFSLSANLTCSDIDSLSSALSSSL
jgi:8-amino-7-oxononanoate synthase